VIYFLDERYKIFLKDITNYEWNLCRNNSEINTKKIIVTQMNAIEIKITNI